jgi:hypothetical protein
MLEVLREVAWGGRNLEWFEGKTEPRDERRADATVELLRVGLIEKAEGYPGWEKHPFRLTDRGHAFLQDVVARIGTRGVGGVIGIDWKGVDEIEFPAISKE